MVQGRRLTVSQPLLARPVTLLRHPHDLSLTAAVQDHETVVCHDGDGLLGLLLDKHGAESSRYDDGGSLLHHHHASHPWVSREAHPGVAHSPHHHECVRVHYYLLLLWN